MMVVIIRLLILAALAWFGFRLVRKLMGDTPSAPGQATGQPRPSPGNEVMQRCAHCGVHLPPGESTQSGGRIFCSEAHRDAWYRNHPPQ